MSVHDEILKYGLKQGTTELLHIDNPAVINGTKCECICPYCQAPLVARKEGKGGRYRQNIHHFAHAMGYEPCGKGGTSALHILAQKVIDEEKKVMLPAYDKKFVKKAARLITFDEVALEKTCKDEISRRRPDCVGKVLSEGIEIWVEIYCTNPINKERRDDIIRQQQYCIEIDFSDLLGTDYTKESIRERLLNSFDDRKWICHPVWDKEEAEKAELRRLEELEREEAKKRPAIADALMNGHIKTIEETKPTTPVPQVTWNISKVEEEYYDPKSEDPNKRDWVMYAKVVYSKKDALKIFYDVLEKDYAKVSLEYSHPFVQEELYLKVNELLPRTHLIVEVTKIYLQLLLAIWVLDKLNNSQEQKLGNIFVKDQAVRNAIFRAVKKIENLNPREISENIIPNDTEKRDLVLQILRICYMK